MAVIYCTRLDDLKGTEDDKSRKLTERYIIKTNSDTDEPSTIYDSSFSGIPNVGDPHPTDPLVRVKSRKVSATENRRHYFMDVEYSNASDDGSTGGGGGGGSVDVIQVTITSWWEDYIEEYSLDENGEKLVRIMNTFGDPIKYEGRRPHPLITITAKTKAPRMDSFLKIVGMVNKQPISWFNVSFDKDQLLFDSYTASSVGSNTWQEQFTFKGKRVINPNGYDFPNRPAGWQPFLLNAGLWEWREEGGERRPSPIYPVDKEGNKRAPNPVTQPWPLYKDGTAISRELFENDVVYLEFTTYQKTDFSIFNFDFAPILDDDAEDRLL